MKTIIFLILGCSSFLFSDHPAELQESLKELKKTRGWCSEQKSNRLVQLALDLKPDVWVEVGVYYGASILPVACALKSIGKGVAVAIDPWDRYETIVQFEYSDRKNITYWSKQEIEYAYCEFTHAIKSFGLDPYLVVLRCNSERACHAIGSIDVLHLDGAHKISSLLKDISLYIPKVKQNGYVIINDVKREEFSLALIEILKTCDPWESLDEGNCLLFRKR
jgi:hypothetical protein